MIILNRILKVNLENNGLKMLMNQHFYIHMEKLKKQNLLNLEKELFLEK